MAVAAVVGAIFLTLTKPSDQESDGGQAAGVPPVGTSSGPGTRQGQTQSPPPTTDASSTSPPLVPQEYYLAQLEPVSTVKENHAGNCTGGCTGFRGGADSVGAEDLPNSYRMRIDGDGRRGVAEFNTLAQCTSLVAIVGISNDSPSTKMAFAVSRDGGPFERIALGGAATPIPVTVDVSSAKRIRIAANVLTGSSVSDDPVAVWGDARLICAPGALE